MIGRYKRLKTIYYSTKQFQRVLILKAYSLFQFQILLNYFNYDKFYLGGAPEYFRGGPNGPSGEFKTLDVSLNSFSLFSGYIPASEMLGMASGVVGDYFFNAGTAVTKKEITGYLQTTVFKTGITGYTFEDTGSIYISTGRQMRTGSFGNASTTNTGEGERYFVYNLFN